jgi:hypothetical protein
MATEARFDTAHTFSDGGEFAMVGGEEAHYPIGLAKIDSADHDRLGFIGWFAGHYL